MTPRLAWDVFMVYLATVNLGVILFDLTYLPLRDYWLRHLPAVVRLYDPVKGIEPHPIVAEVLRLRERLPAAPPEEAREILAALREVGRPLVELGPFSNIGRQAEGRAFVARLVESVGDAAGPGIRLDGVEAWKRLWSPASVPSAEALEIFDDRLRPSLRVLYAREFDRRGSFVDWGWLVDLPFLLVFSIEFYGRWWRAVRRRTYARWFVFPLLYWYDALGIVPLPQFRVFRLFRAVSIYVRLQRSDRSGVGADLLSRLGRYIADVISEEVSDVVSLRILSETQSEIREGTHRRIVREVLTPRRERIAAELTRRISTALETPEVQDHLRRILEVHLEQAADHAPALRALPLPSSLTRPLVRAVGEAVGEAVLQTVAAGLASDEGRSSLEALIADLLDGLVEELTSGPVEELLREATLDALERVKNVVSVRKWAEEPGRDVPLAPTPRRPSYDLLTGEEKDG